MTLIQRLTILSLLAYPSVLCGQDLPKKPGKNGPRLVVRNRSLHELDSRLFGQYLERSNQGAILYRCGKYEEVAQQLAPLVADVEKANPGATSSPVYPLLFMAMTQHRLGEATEALEMLDLAVKLARAELNDESHPPMWNRKLTLELLLKEAEGLIRPKTQPDGPDAATDSSPPTEQTR